MHTKIDKSDLKTDKLSKETCIQKLVNKKTKVKSSNLKTDKFMFKHLQNK